MFFRLCLTALLLSLGQVVLAQDSLPSGARGLPFVTGPLVNGEHYARIIRTGQPQAGVGLYLSRDTLLLGFKEAFPDLGLETYQSLSNYLRSLKVVDCPRVRTSLAWVRNREVRLTGWARTLGASPNDGEKCLLDEERGRYVVSLTCGNIITNLPEPAIQAVLAARRDSANRVARASSSTPVVGPPAIRRDTLPQAQTASAAQPAVVVAPPRDVILDTILRQTRINSEAIGLIVRKQAEQASQLDSLRRNPSLRVSPPTPSQSQQNNVVTSVRNTTTRSSGWKWALGGAVLAAVVCEHNSQKFGSSPGQFRCFARETRVNINIIP